MAKLAAMMASVCVRFTTKIQKSAKIVGNFIKYTFCTVNHYVFKICESFMFYFSAKLRDMLEENEATPQKKKPEVRDEAPDANNQNGQNVENCSHQQGEGKRQWQLGDFSIAKRITEGSFGTVYVAKEKIQDKVIAMKVLFRDQIQKKNLERQVVKEIEMHTRLKHENIIRMFGWFKDAKRIFMVLELAENGDLQMALEAHPLKRFSDQRTVSILNQLIPAMKYIGKRKIIHRDIKPANLFLASQNQVKLGDFGWAVCTNHWKTLPPCGTRNNMAPEMFNNISYDYTVDLWAIGVLTYHFITGANPFVGDKSVIVEKICAADYTFPEFVSEESRDFISKLIVLNSCERLSLDEISNHEWMLKNHSN